MRKGFTLLELSIVLTIIGLVIGGISVGKDMIRNAELQSVITEIESYRTAVETFQSKYQSLPGDMPDAQNFWSNCIDNGGNTCNGDGDGIIENTGSERVRFWQHLSLGELIDGTYTGAQVFTSNTDYFPLLFNDFLLVQYTTNYADKTDTIVTVDRHMFLQGFDETSFDEITFAQLDEKYDDGLPESGFIRMTLNDGSGSGCLTNNSPANYDLSDTGDMNECMPSFLFD